MSQIRIDDVRPAASGKSLAVRSGDQWYNAYLDSGIGAYKGQVVDAEIVTFGKDGKGIKSYKGMGTAPQTLQNAPRGPETVTAAPYWLPMASNVVAHAIAAGLIKEPIDIKKWVFGAMNAAKGAAEGDIGV